MMAPPMLEFRAVDTARWGDFERLFESPGAPHYCWCMVWRATGDERARRTPADRKRAMKCRIDDGMTA